MDYRIVRVRLGSSTYAAVLKLWRANSRWLGFFPRGAFAERASVGQLLAAVRGRKLLGFATVRISFFPRGPFISGTDQQSFSGSGAKLGSGRSTSPILTIVHLCVDPARRGEGIARKIVDHLVRAFPSARTHRLTCRVDFPAARLWPRLGFRRAGDRAGRGGILRTSRKNFSGWIPPLLFEGGTTQAK